MATLTHGGDVMRNRFLCFGIRRAGVTTITYVKDGRIITATLPSPKRAAVFVGGKDEEPCQKTCLQ